MAAMTLGENRQKKSIQEVTTTGNFNLTVCTLFKDFI